jgi:anaerobic magnesium-protoporphyrin IX monomethyl ester cyclase
MRILLIQPAGFHGGAIHHYMPPLGIAMLAAVLRERGFADVRIIDFRDSERWASREELIRAAAPDLIGITAMTPNFPAAAGVARFVRDELGVPVVYGGTHPSAAPENVLRFGCADAVIPGYAEKGFLRLCETLRDGGRIAAAPGAVTLGPDGRVRANPPEPNFPLNEIPRPARDLLPMEEYATYIDSPAHGRIDANGIAASRGCAYRCRFCISGALGGWEGRDPALVCDEIESLIVNYPQPGLLFYDLLLTVSPEWVRALCGEMERRGLNRLKWYAMGRVTVVDAPTLEAMSRAGCVLISYGVESLVDAALRAIGKEQTFEQIERGIRLTHEAGITPMAHFIVGLPGQTERDVAAQMDVIERWIANYHFYPGDFYPMMVFPGTPLFESLPQWHSHNWIDTVSPGFIFPNVPLYTDLIPNERALELSDILNERCRKLLAESSNIYNINVRPRQMKKIE